MSGYSILMYVHMFILTKDSCDCTGSCGNWCDLVWMSVYITMYLEFLFMTYSHNKWLKSGKGIPSLVSKLLI